jgi:OPT family oligopeptide transporter
MVPGYLFPGKAVPNLVSAIIMHFSGQITYATGSVSQLFKSFGAQGLNAGLNFVQDLKLGHYMKIPPRATFMVQVISALFSCLVQIGVKAWLVSTVPDLCRAGQADRLTCPSASVGYTAAIIWGVVGPKRQFNKGSQYYPLLFWMLIGAILPVPFYFLSKRYPHSWVRYIHIPVLLTGLNYIPPATGINYSSWAVVGFIFREWKGSFYLNDFTACAEMRRLRKNTGFGESRSGGGQSESPPFFKLSSRRSCLFIRDERYNFVLSAALEGGTTLCSLVIFLALQLPNHNGFSL